MFPMTVTISNPAQLNAVMAALGVAGIDSPKTSPCAAHAAETAKEEAKVEKQAAVQKKVEPQKTEPLPTEADLGKTAAQAVEALAGHANKPTTASYDDVKAFVLKLSKEKGRDIAVQVLARFGVQKAPDLLPEHFGDFVKLAGEVLEGAQP